jgi:hypothetical protein
LNDKRENDDRCFDRRNAAKISCGRFDVPASCQNGTASIKGNSFVCRISILSFARRYNLEAYCGRFEPSAALPGMKQAPIFLIAGSRAPALAPGKLRNP